MAEFRCGAAMGLTRTLVGSVALVNGACDDCRNLVHELQDAPTDKRLKKIQNAAQFNARFPRKFKKRGCLQTRESTQQVTDKRSALLAVLREKDMNEREIEQARILCK